RCPRVRDGGFSLERHLVAGEHHRRRTRRGGLRHLGAGSRFGNLVRRGLDRRRLLCRGRWLARCPPARVGTARSSRPRPSAGGGGGGGGWGGWGRGGGRVVGGAAVGPARGAQALGWAVASARTVPRAGRPETMRSTSALPAASRRTKRRVIPGRSPEVLERTTTPSPRRSDRPSASTRSKSSCAPTGFGARVARKKPSRPTWAPDWATNWSWLLKGSRTRSGVGADMDEGQRCPESVPVPNPRPGPRPPASPLPVPAAQDPPRRPGRGLAFPHLSRPPPSPPPGGPRRR